MKRKFKIAGLSLVAVFAAIAICQFKGDAWEEYVRSALYKITNDSIPVYSTEYTDEKGIPFVYYHQLNGITAGKQYNPTIVCNYALDYFGEMKPGEHSVSTEKFFYCTSWLADNMSVTGNKALFQFNWQQPWYDSVGVPYTSGMSSGLAIQVFTDAYRLTRSTVYLQHAKALVRGYFIPVSEGGFTYAEKDGWWYEELADPAMHTPRILDGHIFAIIGVHQYWQETKDDSARMVFAKGIEALKNRLPAYDIGNGWAHYDAYKNHADKKYQRILARQMLQLYNITGDVLFKKYYSKWNAPLSKPYFVRVIQERNRSGIILLLLTVSLVFFLLTVAGWIFRRMEFSHR
jgi:hypothetical protein